MRHDNENKGKILIKSFLISFHVCINRGVEEKENEHEFFKIF